MTRNIVLVDFDGVILRNSSASSYIAKKANKYVARTCQLRHDRKSVEQLNKQLYTAYGHTVIGLKHHGVDTSLRSFNQVVYENFMDRKDLKMTEKELKDWSLFRRRMNDLDLEVKFFSNASSIWIRHFLEDDHRGLFDIQTKVESYMHTPMVYDTLLKPQKAVYDIITSMFDHQCKFYFIDDKLNNFQAVNSDPRWIKIWLNGCGETSWHLKTNKCTSTFYAVDVLEHAAELITKLENQSFK